MQIDREIMHRDPEQVFELVLGRPPGPADIIRVTVIAQALRQAFDEGATAVCDGLEFADIIDSGQRKFWMESVKKSKARI